VAGDREFYNVVSARDPHYPKRRWEFDRTINELDRLPFLAGELLESGAGDGAFLKILQRSRAGTRFQTLALEYDEGALSSLRANGYAALAGSITEIAEAAKAGRFAVICLFQTLEHLEDAHAAFESFGLLCEPGGHIFLSVPNAHAIDTQERLVRYWDMPPNHLGRWTEAAFRLMARQHGLEFLGCEVEPTSRLRQAWTLSVYSVNAKAYEGRTLAGRVNAIGPRLVRGPAKRLLAAFAFVSLFFKVHGQEGESLWVHLRKPATRA
jgi:SAM-dependent methyltransferase